MFDHQGQFALRLWICDFLKDITSYKLGIYLFVLNERVNCYSTNAYSLISWIGLSCMLPLDTQNILYNVTILTVNTIGCVFSIK